MEDVVRVLEYRTLGSRLKRIGERLQAQTHDLVVEMDGSTLPPPQAPILVALRRNGPMSIGDLTKALGQRQPGVTRMAGKLKEAGLVHIGPHADDKRISMVSLTKEGAELDARLESEAWPAVERAVRSACAGLDGPFMDQLAQLEDALEAIPLKKRRT